VFINIKKITRKGILLPKNLSRKNNRDCGIGMASCLGAAIRRSPDPATDGLTEPPYFGKVNLSSRPISKAGFLRFRTKTMFSESAVTSIGMAMVESQ